MIRRLILWLDDRLASASFTKKALRKAFPDHWSFMLGEIALYAFVALAGSGVFMGLLFDASADKVTYHGPFASLDGRTVSAAYASVLRLSSSVGAGLLVRQCHHWAALVFVAAIVAHMARIFFTGAFRKPRDLNWYVGTTLLLLAMGEGFTGYSLPDDLLSGTGLRIAYSILVSVPVVGSWAALLLFGGTFPSDVMTSRLFLTHVFLVPLAIAGAIGVHLAILWRQKHSQFRGPGRTEGNVVGSPLWPAYAFKSIGLALATFGVLAFLGGFLQINPIWQYGPYDPWTVASPAQPDWYVGWLDGALRLGPGFALHPWGHTVAAVFWPGVILPLVMFAFIYAWPSIERRVTGDDRVHHLLDLPYDVPWRTAAGVAFLTFATVLIFAGSDDVQARIWHVAVEHLSWTYRVALVIAPVVAGFLAYRIAREVRARVETAEGRASKRVGLRRTAAGGFEKGQPGAP